MSKIRILLAATFVFIGAAEAPSCLGDDNVSVIKKEQKLDVVLKSLKDANAKCEEQHLAVRWEKGLSGKIFYIERPGHPEKPLKMVATKAKDAREAEFVVTSLDIYDSYEHDSKSPKNLRKNLYTPVDEVKIDSLKREKPKT
jgi:hypothetical protein